MSGFGPTFPKSISTDVPFTPPQTPARKGDLTYNGEPTKEITLKASYL